MPIAKLAAFLDMVSKREMICVEASVCNYFVSILHSGSKKGEMGRESGDRRRDECDFQPFPVYV